jgi:hypothetical protein
MVLYKEKLFILNTLYSYDFPLEVVGASVEVTPNKGTTSLLEI